MKIDFEDIKSYLPQGNPRQKSAYDTLVNHRIMERLADFGPILAGTIPIGIDIEGSDLDIICRYPADAASFAELMTVYFGHHPGFEARTAGQAAIASFLIGDFTIEIFALDIPAREQNAYRHMLIEYNVLKESGEEFRRRIIELKRQGIKTEPAFARLLGLEGDPYQALLDYKP